jgi:hypothetical protein
MPLGPLPWEGAGQEAKIREPGDLPLGRVVRQMLPHGWIDQAPGRASGVPY